MTVETPLSNGMMKTAIPPDLPCCPDLPQTKQWLEAYAKRQLEKKMTPYS
jgi:hypothetical protein